MPVTSHAKPYLLLTLCVVAAFRSCLGAVFDNSKLRPDDPEACTYTVVETIPEGMTFASQYPKHLTTYDAWTELINVSTCEIKIASFYWTLSANLAAYPSANLSAPPFLTTAGRTEDIDAILDVIRKAKEFVYVAVMNYLPLDYYSKTRRFWSVIDDALRRAAIENGVRVRLLVSKWSKTKPVMWNFVESLASLNTTNISIEVKAMMIPAFTEEQRKTPYARVNHQKMMVTDTAAYIGTSNWEPNYFIKTTGVGLVINQNSSDSIRGQLKAIFERDWNSNFTYYVRPGHRRKLP
ncbi:hypothetical protein MTO96_022349 [Rhipicephalus appendiculatus]